MRHIGYRLLVLSLAAGWLSGCATLNEAECKQGDWYQIGFADGAAGKPESQVGKHREACTKYQIAPNLNQWLAGYQRGLIGYCTPEKGYEVGMDGQTYHGVCPPETAADFRWAYERGQRIYHARMAVQRIEDRIDSLERRESMLRQDRRLLNARLNDPALTDAQQYQLLQQLENIEDDMDDLYFQIRDLAFDLHRAERKLDEVKRLNAFIPGNIGRPLY